MQFCFWLGNHNETGQRSLEDVIGIMGHQLRALGHQAVWDKLNDKFILDGINVVVEGFTPAVNELLERGRRNGARFLILATEEPTERGFNHGTQPEMVMRQKHFPKAAELCEGILHLVPGEHVTSWYAQFAPTAQAELGYADSLVRTGGGHMAQPDFDFGFYGSLSPRRLKLLKRLAKRAGSERAVRIVADFKTQAERDHEMRRAKVIIQVRKFDAMGLVSSSRCCTALCLGRPVVAEPHELSHPWDKIVRFSQTEEGFLNAAMMVRAAWRGVWSDQFGRFKQMLTPEFCVGEPLRRIGILPPKYLTVDDVLRAHAEHGRLNWQWVKDGMGPNWPEQWEQLGPGGGIFDLPQEQRA